MGTMRRFAHALLIAVIALTIASAACGGGDDAADRVPHTAASGLPIIELRYDGGTLLVEYANTPEAHTLGLGNRAALAEESGMIFDLDRERVPRFWMKGMRFPLDMVWIASDGRIAVITSDIQPQPDTPDSELRFYSPDIAVRYVLELNAGASRRLGLAAGDQLSFDLNNIP